MASRISAAAFLRKTASTGVLPPPVGSIPPPYKGISPVYVARNVVLGSGAGYFAYWSYTKVILPRVNATFRPAATPVAESRIEVLATPLTTRDAENEIPTVTAVPISVEPASKPMLPLDTAIAADIHALQESVIPSESVSVPIGQPSSPDFVVRHEDPWWLPWLPLQQISELLGLSPWPFDYNKPPVVVRPSSTSSQSS